MLLIEVLGVVRTVRDGQPVESGRSRWVSQLLLGYLVVHPGQRPRSEIAALLWPDVQEAPGRAELARVVHSLRERLGPVIVGDRGHLGLDQTLKIRTDLHLFDLAEADPTAHHLLAAATAYRGPFLQDVPAADHALGEWLELERERQSRRFVAVLAKLAGALRAEGQVEQALTWANRWCDHAPLDEQAHRTVMSLLADAGRTADAVVHFEDLVASLRQDLDVAPDPVTVKLVDEIRLTAAIAHGRARDLPSLPIPSTPTVGREVLLSAAVKQLSTTGTRLMTLTGPGGVGKTRLSVDIASTLIGYGEFDAAVLVELAAVREASLVLSTIAATLHLAVTGDPMDAVAHRLAGGRTLLVLDNVEQIDGAAAIVTSLLKRLPAMTVLLTSRGPLHLREEQVVAVPPLDPAATMVLFTQRGQAARQSFDPAIDNQVVQEACRKLDGLPLVIELAAAQLRLLSIGAVNARLGDRLDLRGRETDRPDRHRTLRDTVLWSYDLLDPQLQQLFRVLGVFRGGATERTVTHFLDLQGDDRSATGVLGRLEGLVDAGLLQVDPGVDEPRFTMLPTITEVALGLLAGFGLSEAAAQLHLEVFLPLVQASDRLGTDPDGTEQLDRLDRVDVEMDNIRAAMDHSQPRDPVAFATLCAGLSTYWLARNHRTETAERLDVALAMAEYLDDEMVGQLLTDRGYLETRYGRPISAEQFAVLADPIAARAAPGSWLPARVMWLHAGSAAHRGDIPAISATVYRAVELARDVGDVRTELVCLTIVNGLLVATGADGVQELISDALQLVKATGGELWVHHFLTGAASLAHYRGDLQEAARLYRDALVTGVRAAEVDGRKYVLLQAAQNALAMGRVHQSAQLVGAVQALLAIPGESWVPFMAGILDEIIASVVDAVGAQKFDTDRRTGWMLDEESLMAMLEDIAQD